MATQDALQAYRDQRGSRNTIEPQSIPRGNTLKKIAREEDESLGHQQEKIR